MTMRTGPWGAARLAVLVLFVWAGAALAAPTFPPLTGRVVDDAGILSPQAEAQLTQELANLETQTGRQLVVATLPDLQGYEIEDYGYQLLRTWGIGSKERNDGAILIVAPSERKVRIEVGYGLEDRLTDAQASVIINQVITPAFKAGNYKQGISDGVGAILQVLGGAPLAKPAYASGQGSGDDFMAEHPGVVVLLFILFVLVVAACQFYGICNSGGGGSRSGGFGGGGFGGGGGGGFRGGGGSFGGGGASGGW